MNEIVKICKKCDISFVPKRSTKGIYCSIKCRIQDKKIEPPHRVCEFCNKYFIASVRCVNSKQKYCSQSCFKLKLASKNKNLININKYECYTHGIMELNKFRKIIRKGYRDRYQCKECDNNRCKEYRLNNIEKIKEKRRKYYQNNKKENLIRSNEWRKKNNEKVLKHREKYRKKYKEKISEKRKNQIKELKRYYIKSCMTTTLKINEIPEELIELKKYHMMLKRKIKEINDANK